MSCEVNVMKNRLLLFVQMILLLFISLSASVNTSDAAVVRYYVVASSGTSVGVDGDTNIPNGSWADIYGRTLFSTIAPTASDTMPLIAANNSRRFLPAGMNSLISPTSMD